MSTHTPSTTEIHDACRRWKIHLRMWQFAHVSLGLLATVCSIAVAAYSGPSPAIKVLAFIAATASGLHTAFNIGQTTSNVHNAWRSLKRACLLHENSEISDRELIEQWFASEQTIGHVTYSPHSNNKEQAGSPKAIATTSDNEALDTEPRIGRP
jgi:hypothetical protein